MKQDFVRSPYTHQFPWVLTPFSQPGFEGPVQPISATAVVTVVYSAAHMNINPLPVPHSPCLA